MSFSVDPVISSFFFTLSLLPHTKSPERQTEDTEMTVSEENLPHVLVLVPLYQEVPEAVERTFESLKRQSYPAEKVHVRAIVEEGDETTSELVHRFKTQLSDVDFRVVVNTQGGMKAGAMNYALEHEPVDTEFLVIYDGDDKFEADQLLKLVSTAVLNEYDAVMPRVYRVGDSLLSKLLTLDTHLWNTKVLPFLYENFGVFPQSGEGCFLRRSVVEELGGFPHTLTEDAMMSMMVAEAGGKFGLVDSRVYEQAPTSLQGHYTQRRRWNRGYFTCLRKLFGADLNLRKKFGFALAFIAPITVAFTLPVWLLFGLYWGISLFGGPHFIAPWMTTEWYTPFFYWGVALGYLGNVFVLFSYMQTIAGTDFEKYASHTLLLPLYWIFLSVSAIGSVFKGTKQWGRTDRAR